MYLSIVEDPNTQLPKLSFVVGKSPKRLKIALLYEGMRGQSPHPEVKKAIVDTAQLCQQLGHTVEETKPLLDQAKLGAAASQVGAVEVAKAMDAIAKAKGLRRLEDGFESRALGLREEAMRKGPFDEQIATALPTLEAGAATLDQFFQQWDVLLTPVLRFLFRVRVEGGEHIPTTGAAILASNHVSFSDSIFLPLVLRRRITTVRGNLLRGAAPADMILANLPYIPEALRRVRPKELEYEASRSLRSVAPTTRASRLP